MFELINKTRFVANLLPTMELDGAQGIMVLVKGTFGILDAGRLQLGDEQVPLTLADEYNDDPNSSSLRYASDLVPEKRGTDVVLNGTAYAPKGRAKVVDVTVEAGPLKKTVRVFGDRRWNKFFGMISISSPLPFSSTPLIYERAFGGVDQTHKNTTRWAAEERNPVGTGLIANKAREDLEEISLPNLEDPSALITSYQDRPKPAGFGFIAPGWKPRLEYAGTYDEAWTENRFPLLPADFDSRFHNSAHPDLISKDFFQGGEHVGVTNASRKGILTFDLPNLEVNAAFYIDGRVTKQVCDLDTVIIEPDEERVLLIWRAKVRCHRKLKYVTGAKVMSQDRGG